jgi:hypothetical protein
MVVILAALSVLFPLSGSSLSYFGQGCRRYRSSLKNPYVVRVDGLSMAAEKTKQSRSSSVISIHDEDDEKPAGIVGAQFFGGDKRKEEYYDPQAEMEAGLELAVLDKRVYHRFSDRDAFPDPVAAAIAESCQKKINRVLFADEDDTSTVQYAYSPLVRWETVFPRQSVKSTPLQELEKSLDFYRRVNVAIVSGESIPLNTASVVKLRWEISVLWPTVWEPRILITGSSELIIDSSSNQIIQQKDTLDADLLRTIQKQFFPRFWDLYHIGMTPVAEVSPTFPVPKRNLFASYRILDIPPRVILQPSQFDTNREDANASILPNHAYSCVIKTMGPEKQFYTPVTGVQVRLLPTQDTKLQLQWSIPISTEYLSNPVLVLPGPDPEIPETLEPTCDYVFQSHRRVATIAYGGSPQDPEISKLRKELYDKVTQDGYKPLMDASGRPIFFFTTNAIKACYTDEGLGMAVYEWRPQFTKSNEIGIELEA